MRISKPVKNLLWSFFAKISGFFTKKIFYEKMSLKRSKTLRKCLENLPHEMPELQFFKILIFPKAL